MDEEGKRMEFGRRLRDAMARAGMNAREVTERSGVAIASVYNYRHGRRLPPHAAGASLAEALGVRPEWLLFGTGPREPGNVLVAEALDPSAFVRVPVYRVGFACGEGQECQIMAHEIEGCPPEVYGADFFVQRRLNPAHCKVVFAQGDSMEPLICDGDKVLIDCDMGGAPNEIIDGRVYAFVLDGALRIKRLRRKAGGVVVLVSENPAYEPEEVGGGGQDGPVMVLVGLVVAKRGDVR